MIIIIVLMLRASTAVEGLLKSPEYPLEGQSVYR